MFWSQQYSRGHHFFVRSTEKLALMRFVLPTSGLDLACAVPNFTGIPTVTAQPTSSVYTQSLLEVEAYSSSKMPEICVIIFSNPNLRLGLVLN